MSDERRVTQPAPTHDEFYVGYRAAPRGLVRLMRIAVPPLLAVVVFIGFTLARRQNDPGPGVWDTERVRTLEGMIDVAPYAQIRVLDADSPEGVRTILLVQEGKFGAIERVEGLVGRPAWVRGTVLERDGRQLLELDSTEDAVQSFDGLSTEERERLKARAAHPGGRRTLRGEIIDPKCFFGAMKPGEGKPHKQCATLCISGGIPPMFRCVAGDGATEYYLLVSPGGAAANEAVLPFVADPIELSGDIEQRGDLHVLTFDPSNLRRL